MVFSSDTDQNPTCDTGLGLALCGRHERPNQENIKKVTLLASLRYDNLLPSLSLGLSQDHHLVNQINPDSTDDHDHAAGEASIGGHQEQVQHNQASSLSTGGVSSFSNSNSVKKEMREYYYSGEELEVEKINSCSRLSSNEHEDHNHDQEDGSPRKKLRLCKQQSAILEDSFKDHTTLNPKQKQALAEQLNLRPRQVEVWFQNRRARTKLKKTEVDCELLKKCCETLTEENRRLQKEVQELRSLKLTASFYMQLPAATLMSMCPSCERLGSSHGGDGSSGSPLIPISPKPHHLYNSNFSHSSAAC